MDLSQVTNRLRKRDDQRAATRFWIDYLPSGAKQRETVFHTTIGIGNYAEIHDVKGQNPFRLSKSARKLMRSRKIPKKDWPKRAIVRNDMSKYSVLKESSVDDLWLGFPNRSFSPTWGAVNIKGPIGPALFVNYGPDSYRPFGFDAVLNTSLERLIIAAFAKAKSPELLVGEFAGTLKQTIEMFRKPLDSSMRLLKKMFAKKQLWIKRGLTPVAALSAAWLEFRFGWRPLFLDFVKILEELDKTVITFSPETKVARAKEDIQFNGESTLSDTALDGRYSFRRKLLYDIRVTVRAGASYRCSFTGLEEYNRRFLGLRLHDVFTTAWELVPWSWLVDYFLHIGNFLEAGLPTPEVTMGDYWVSYKGKYVYRGIYSPNMTYFPAGVVPDNAVDPFYAITWQDHVRYVNPTLSWIPQPDLNGLSSIQALNLTAALFAKAFKAVPAIARR